MAKRRYFGGDSEAQAVIAAAGQFGIDPSELAFEVIDKKHGFTKRRRRVLISVDPEAPAKAAAPAAPEPEVAAPAVVAEADEVAPVDVEAPAADEEMPEPEVATRDDDGPEAEEAPAADEVNQAAAEAAPEPDTAPDEEAEPAVAADEGPAEAAGADGGDRGEDEGPGAADEDEGEEIAAEAPPPAPLDAAAVDRIVGLVDTMLDLADLDVEPAVTIDDGNVLVDVDGPEREFLLEDGGELLDALDYLGYRMCRQAGYQPESFRVDSKGFRGEREEKLKERAAQAAEEAVRTGEMVAFEPLDPASRRIVHMALRETEGVETVSHGKGFLKRVKIFPQD